jgi:hypothetical protein
MGYAPRIPTQMVKLRHILLLVPVATLLHALPASAACRQPDPKVCAEFFKSDVVFVGTVLALRTVPTKGDFYDGWWYRLRVRKMFRGPDRETVEVFTENSSVRFPLTVGNEYLLFAKDFGGRLEIAHCGNSGLLSQSLQEIQEIEQIGKVPTGTIEGRVVSPATWKGVDEVRVTARGEDGAYSAVTGPNG